MAYTTNPFLPKVRAQAVDMLRSGKTQIEVARYIGVNQSVISKWNAKAPLGGCVRIATQSSRPFHHPRELKESVIGRILEIRKEHGRCAEAIHQQLLNEGICVSLSSVKRTIERAGLVKKRTLWKRWHKTFERPQVLIPGSLVELDTIHLMQTQKTRIYVYTLLDVYSRWAYAQAQTKISAWNSTQIVTRAMNKATFEFHCVQSDHGPEFSQNFTERIHVPHRHSRVRQPDDNAHVERFNRTIQDEFLDALPKNVALINHELPDYLDYYNTKRLHLGIHLKTPQQML